MVTAALLVVVGLATIFARLPAVGVDVPAAVAADELQDHVRDLDPADECCGE